MANENLTGALRASLQLVEKESDLGPIDPSTNSPLREATPDSIDVLLSRINEAFGQGLPESVTDETLRQLVDQYRAQTLRWEQDEQTRRDKPRTPRGPKKSIAQAIQIDL